MNFSGSPSLSAADVLDSISDGFYALDFGFRFTYLNRRAEQILMRSRDELLGKNIWDEFAPAAETIFFEKYVIAMRDRVTVTFEAFYLPLDCWVHVSAYPIPEGLSVYFQDISDRKTTEAALGQSEERYRILAESVPQLIWSCKPDGNCDYLSRQWIDFTGIPEQDQLGSGWTVPIHPEDRERAFAAWRAAVEERASYDVDYRLKRHDGVYRWFQARGVAIRGLDGQIARWAGTSTDIHDAKCLAEDLAAIEARFRAGIDAVSDIVWTNDNLGRMRGEQPGWGAFTGQAESQYQGYGWADAVHPEDAQPTIDAWEKAVESRRTFIYEHRVKRWDGVYRNCAIRAVPVFDDAGRIREWVGVHADITDRRRAEEEREQLSASLRSSNEALKRSNEDLQQFAYVSSHDLQEPLRTLITFTQLLDRQYHGQLGPEADEITHAITHAAKRMNQLILDLLAYSRATMESDRVSASVDSNAVLAWVRDDLKLAMHETGALVTSDLLPVVPGDETQLRQVFQNLIGNAIKYRRSDAAPTLHISAEQANGRWKFAFRDNGIGFEPMYRERIFGLFKRLHNQQSYPGTGIGLAICKTIVERHGGEIWAESAPDEGSTFFFTLPASPQGHSHN